MGDADAVTSCSHYFVLSFMDVEGFPRDAVLLDVKGEAF